MIKESFLDATKGFSQFLSKQGLASDLIWIFEEDIICLPPKRFLLKMPLRTDNEAFAETWFNIGVKRDHGLALTAFCLLDGNPCCYIQVPEDDLDAQYSLMGNLSIKYSVRTDLVNAESVGNPVSWFAYVLKEKILDTRFCGLEKMPTRKALLKT